MNDIRQALYMLELPNTTSQVDMVKDLCTMSHKSGEVARKEFVQVMEVLMEGQKTGGDEAEKRQQEVLNSFNLFLDNDKASHITISDLRRIAEQLGEKIDLEGLEDMIREGDRNGNGYVTLEDFGHLMQRAGAI